MVDLVVVRASGVLAVSKKRPRIAPKYVSEGGHLARAAWYAGYDAEVSYQNLQLEFPHMRISPRLTPNYNLMTCKYLSHKETKA